MKAYVVAVLARQVDGEWAAMKIERCFTDKDKVEKALNGMKFTEVIQTGIGPINCVCERGVYEVEIEE